MPVGQLLPYSIQEEERREMFNSWAVSIIKIDPTDAKVRSWASPAKFCPAASNLADECLTLGVKADLPLLEHFLDAENMAAIDVRTNGIVLKMTKVHQKQQSSTDLVFHVHLACFGTVIICAVCPQGAITTSAAANSSTSFLDTIIDTVQTFVFEYLKKVQPVIDQRMRAIAALEAAGGQLLPEIRSDSVRSSDATPFLPGNETGAPAPAKAVLSLSQAQTEATCLAVGSVSGSCNRFSKF